MAETPTNATGEHIAGREGAPAVILHPERRLIAIGAICPGKIPVSKRAWYRLCAAGKAPWGIKLGSRRVWSEAEIDGWIAGGCKPVRKAGEVARGR